MAMHTHWVHPTVYYHGMLPVAEPGLGALPAWLLHEVNTATALLIITFTMLLLSCYALLGRREAVRPHGVLIYAVVCCRPDPNESPFGRPDPALQSATNLIQSSDQEYEAVMK